jgi:hypothetical protein
MLKAVLGAPQSEFGEIGSVGTEAIRCLARAEVGACLLHPVGKTGEGGLHGVGWKVEGHSCLTNDTVSLSMLAVNVEYYHFRAMSVNLHDFYNTSIE